MTANYIFLSSNESNLSKKNINGWDQLALYAYRIDGSSSPIRYFFSDTRISILSHNEQKDGYNITFVTKWRSTWRAKKIPVVGNG